MNRRLKKLNRSRDRFNRLYGTDEEIKKLDSLNTAIYYHKQLIMLLN